jgi:hypothetical protein
MSDQRPAPLVDAKIELRDFPFLPLDVVRLRDSELAISATGDEFRAAVLLWCASWHQKPAASLPNDDKTLAAYAGYGRDIDGWKGIREGALRNFVECADGRLYHQVLAEKAIDAWDGKLRHRFRRECERIKKAAQRAHADPLYPTFEQWKTHVAETGSDKWERKDGDVLDVSPGTNSGQQEGQTQGHDENVPGVSQPPKGQGEGQGEGEGSNKPKSSLRSDSSTGKPSTRAPKKVDTAKEARLAQVTRDAMAAYNGILALPKGLLQRASDVGFETKCENVRRCVSVARQICARQYDSDHITPKFWQDYFRVCHADNFHSGRAGGGKGHEAWLPDFEYLTRKVVMIEVFEKATSGDGGEHA